MKNENLYTLCDVKLTGNNQPEAVRVTVRSRLHYSPVLDKERQALRLPNPDGTWASVEDSANFFGWIRATQAWCASEVTITSVLMLPSVMMSARKWLPDEKGIYFLAIGDQIQYIGMTTMALRRRWASHHAVGKLEANCSPAQLAAAKIYYLELRTVENHWISFIEQCLIRQMLPALNCKLYLDEDVQPGDSTSLSPKTIKIHFSVTPDQFDALESAATASGHTFGHRKRAHVQGYIASLVPELRTQPVPALDNMIALNAETEYTEAELRESLTEMGVDPDKLIAGVRSDLVNKGIIADAPDAQGQEEAG